SNCIVSKKANDNANGYVLYNDGYYPSKLNFRMRGTLGSANMLHSKSNVEIGVLQHWAVAYDPNAKQARIYKNGILDRTYEAITIGNMNNEIPLHIGRSHTWGGYFSGIMNDLMIFERTLTTEEIRQIYTSQRRD
ncbi:MAG: LamG domain-containing protein, partial [bacterium]